MTDKRNIHAIPNKTDKLLGAVEDIKRNLSAYIEMATVMAEIRRAHYDAYIKKGFTEDQAVTLCQKVTL